MDTAIFWLRRDLRLTDNPALIQAARFDRLLPVYIHDPESDGGWPPGAASNWWLHHSLSALARDFEKHGSRLVLLKGPAAKVLEQLARETGAGQILWNRRYEPAGFACDQAVEARLSAIGRKVRTFNASLLFEPWEVHRADAGPYRVFTAFWKAGLARGGIESPRPAPANLPPPPPVEGIGIEALGLLPSIRWDTGFAARWTPGENGALSSLYRFVSDAVPGYCDERDFPGHAGTSQLSPHLHFGEIGPRQIAAALANIKTKGGECHLRQLGWREFAHHLLFHFPDTTTRPLNARFAAFPWRTDYAEDLKRWQRGVTGIPLVDAGMRELWQTGWMHNRVRMVAASFLTKNLLVPWQEGALWFWDTLVDADLANNTMGWQWVAGSGADAAPYFRIFNPVLQGERFDADGAYVRHWIPELAGFPVRFIHQPWKAPKPARDQLPAESPYAEPMVDMNGSRNRALEAYKRLD